MTIRKLNLLLFLIVLIPRISIAQQQDFQAWGGIGIKHEMSKKADFSAGYEVRYENNATNFDVSYFSAGYAYKLNKNFTAGLDVRYGTNNVWDKFRYGAGITCKKIFSKLQLSARAKYEYEHFMQALPEIGQFPARNNFRLKIEAQYKLVKDVKVFLSSEPQYRIVASDKFFQRVRNIAGLDWEIFKNHELSFAWYFQPEYNVQGVHDFTAHIFSIGYTWNLPKKEKKKK